MIHRYGLYSVLVAALALPAGCATSTTSSKGIPIEQKKVIGFAPDMVNMAYIAENVDEVEQTPVDGLIVAVFDDNWMGRKDQRNTIWFGGIEYEKEDFKQLIATVKRAKFKRFTDNFVDFQFTVNKTSFIGPDGKLMPAPEDCTFATVDWFDDGWSKVAQNGAVAAYVARECGAKGLFMDAEGYFAGTGIWPWPFSYIGYSKQCKKAGLTPRTPEECVKQVRLRGRQFMEAIVAEYPDITIMIIPSIHSAGDGAPPFLFPAFVDGMLEAKGDEVTIIDGIESGYPLLRYDSFMKQRQYAEDENLRKSSRPDLMKKVSYGYGVWVDFECRKRSPFAGWHTDDPAEFELNYRSPARLEHSLYNALTVSDKYVWLFGWHPKWWWMPSLRHKDHPKQRHDQCHLCPHGELPQAYFDALANCRKPHDLHWQEDKLRSLEEKTHYMGYIKPWVERPTYAQLKRMGKNLLVNGSFEEWGVEERVGWPRWKTFEGVGPIGWNIFGVDPVVKKNEELVKSGKYSVTMGTTVDTSREYLDQNMDAKPWRGKTIMFGAWFKSSKPDRELIAQVLDVVADGGEQDGAVSVVSNGKWQFIVTQKEIREDAVKIIFRFVTRYDSDAPVCFDRAIAVEKK